MAGSTQGIQIPIDLQIKNLRDISDQIKSFASKNLLENAFSSKKINGELDRVGKLLDQISAKSKQAFTSNSDFTSITRDIAALEIEFNKMQDSVINIRFEDIKIPSEAQGQIEALTNKINELKGSLNNIKQIELGKLLSNADFIKDFNIANPGKGAKILEKGYDEVEKAIKVGMGRVNTALQIANTEYQNLQANFNANTFGKSNFERAGALDFLSKAFQKLPSEKEQYNAEQKIMSQFMNTATDSKGQSSFTSFQGGVWGSRGFLQMLQNNYSFSQTEINAIAQRARETAQELNKKVSEVWQQAGQDDTLAKKLLFGDQSSNVTAAAEQYKQQLDAVNAAKANLEEKIKQSDAMNRLNTAFQGPSQEVAQQAEALKNALRAPQAELEQLKASVLSSVTAFPALGQAFSAAAAEISTVTTRIQDGRAKLASLDATINKMQGVSNFINRYIGLYAIINKVTKAIRDAFNNIRELDKVITDIAVVTNMSQTDLWGKISEYTSMAQQYGVATKDVYSVSQIFYQQGLQTSQVMSLTTETLKMAKIAGIDYADAANAMTVAVRAYNIEMSNAQMVTDVYSALAAKFAVSSAEIANAMEKTASSAASVGMTLQSTSAFISVMEQTTRESAQNIGSALKSIISRYGEMKASPDKLLNIEGEEVAFNKVDTALASIGISIKDASGQFRDFDDVIIELASKWNTLDNNTQRYIATIMAGNRQQSRFIALVSNYSELSRAMSVASNAENTSIVQTAKTLDSLESKTNQLKNAFSQLYLDLHIEDGMKATYDWLTRIISTIGKLGTGNGALSTLTTLINSGFGAKQLINTISDIYKQKRLQVQGQVDADTSKANAKIEELIKKAQGPYEAQINAKVDNTQVKELETAVDNITNKLNNINTAVVSSTATTVPQIQKPITPDVFQSQLYAAFASGGLNNTASQQQFLASAGMQTDMGQYATISAMLSSFDGSAAAAQELTAAFANATGQIMTNAASNTVAAEANMAEAAASQQSSVADQIEGEASSTIAGVMQSAGTEIQSGASQIVQSSNSISTQLAIIPTQLTGAVDQVVQNIMMQGQAMGLGTQAIQGLMLAAYNASNGLALFSGMTIAMIQALLPPLSAAGIDVSKLSQAAGLAQVKVEAAGALLDQTGITVKNSLIAVAQSSNEASQALRGLSESANQKNLPAGLKAIPDQKTPLSSSSNTNAETRGPKSWFRNDENGALKFSPHGMTGMMLATSAVRMLAPLITAAGAAHKDTSKDNIETSKVLTGLGNGISGAATGASIGMLAGPMGAFVGGALGFILQGAGAILDGFDYNLQERIAKAEEEVQAANTESLKKQAKVIDISSNIENLKQLQVAMYNSEEDMKAYKDAMANLASEYPNLVSAYDTAGNAIIDIQSAEAELSSARLEGAVAARNAALAEIDASNLRLQSYHEEVGPGSTLDFLRQYIDIANGKAKEIATTEYGEKIYQDANGGMWTTTGFDGELHVELPGELTGNTKNLGLSLVSLDDWVAKNKKLLGVSSLSEITGKDSYSDYDTLDLSKIVELITAKYEAESRKNSSLHDTANVAIGNETFFSLTDTKAGLSQSQVTQLEESKNFQGLFNSMLIKNLPGSYTSLYDWKNAENSDFNKIATDVYDQFIAWYNSLSADLKDEFSNIDFTLYGREELIQKFNLSGDENKDIRERFINNFITANKNNRDRILKTIYGEEEGQQTWDLNKNLKGLSKFSTTTTTPNGEIQERNIALDIAYKFAESRDKTSAILSQYADYFTTQLLDINELAENGYTELAQNRLNILGKISEALAGADSSTQRDLFSTLTKVDFSDYESITNAAKALETYKTPENAAQIDPILTQLTAAQESLLFNVTSLAQGLVDSISNAAKDINSLLSANKSGLSFDKALDAFKELNTDLSFDKVFNYDAILGQYVYTSDGLQQAIAAKEGKLQEQVDQLNAINKLYQDNIGLDNSGEQPLTGSPKITTEDLRGAETGADLYSIIEGQLSDNTDQRVKQIWQELSDRYIKETDVLKRSQEGWYDYLETIAQGNDAEAKKAQAVLDNYKANKKNILYQSIDWSKLALGTDFSGNNRNMAIELAKEIGLYVKEGEDWVWKTLNGVKATNEEILNQYLSKLYEGQENADQLIEQAKARIKGQIESSQSEQGSKAITEILADQGTKLSEETIAYINQLKGDNLLKDVKVGEDGTLTAEDITKTLDPISVAIEVYQQNVKDSIYTTLAERNKSYGEIITKTFSKTNAGKNLLAAGNKLDLSTIESSLTALGINWDEIYDAATQTWQGGFENVLSTDAFGKTTIKDWNAFVTALKGKGLDLTEVSMKEYQKWYRAYLDGQVNDLNDTNEKAAQDALSKLTSAGSGENVNVQALRDAGIDMSVLDPDNNGLYKVIDAYSRDSAILAINTAEITNKALKDAIEAAQQKILALGNFATATSYATKGASSLSEVDSFKQSYEQLVGESLSDEAFVYDTIQQSFVLDTSYMQKYIEAQKNRMLKMGYTEEFVNQYIKDQTDRAIQDSIALDGFLNATTNIERNDEANKLIQQIRGLSNYKDLFTQDSSLIQKLKDHHFDQESFSRDWEQYQEQYDLLILETLESGGQDAVDLLKQIKPDASPEELEAAFNSQINKLNDAMNQVGDLVAGQFIGTEGKLYEILSDIHAVDDNGVIVEGFRMVEAYARIYAEMKETATSTTADLNNAYVQLLTAQDQESVDLIEALNNASGMTYEAIGQIFTRYGIELEQALLNSEDAGIARVGYNKIAITDFAKFKGYIEQAIGHTIEVGTQEYLDAYSAYVDSQINMRNQGKNNLQTAFDQLKSVTEAKVGDLLNVTYLEDAFDKSTKTDKDTLVQIAEKFGASIKDGILTISKYTDVPGLLQAVAEEAGRAGLLIPEQLAELTDAIADMLSNITSLISNGITGTLNNTDALSLQNWAEKQGLQPLEFNQTVEGLQLTADSIAMVYAEMKRLNSLQAQSLLSTIIESNDRYSTLASTLQAAAEVTQRIDFTRATIANPRRTVMGDVGANGVALITPVLPDGTELGDDWAKTLATKYANGEINLTTKLQGSDGQELSYTLEDVSRGLYTAENAVQQATSAMQSYNDAAESAAGANKDFTASLDSLTAQSSLMSDIVLNKLTDPDAMNFMSDKLPDNYQVAINAWENASKAIKTLTAAQKSGYIGVEDFYNIVNTSAGLLEAAGKEFNIKGMNAAELIEAACMHLKVVDGDLKVDLSSAGLNMVSGVDDLKNNLTDGVHELADAEVAILDAEIEVLEVLAAMEAMGEMAVDVDNNGISFELNDMFTFNVDGDVKGFTDDMKAFLDQMQDAIETSDELEKAVKAIQVNGTTLYDLFYGTAKDWEKTFGSAEAASKFMQKLSNIDWGTDINTIQTQIVDAMKDLGQNLVIDVGDNGLIGITATGQLFNIDLDDKDVAKQAQQAVNAFRTKYPDFFDGTNLRDNVKQLINELNNPDSNYVQADLQYTLKVVTGEIKIEEEKNDKGQKTGKFVGEYAGVKFRADKIGDVEKYIKQAIDLENQGLSKIEFNEETGEVSGTLNVGAARIKVTKNGDKTTIETDEIDGERYKGDTVEGAVKWLAERGYADNKLAGKTWSIDGTFYEVIQDNELGITYTFTRSTDGNSWLYNGMTFPSYDAMAKYIRDIVPLEQGLSDDWHAAPQNSEEGVKTKIWTNGTATIEYNVETGEIIILADGITFKSRAEADEYLAEKAMADQQADGKDHGVFEDGDTTTLKYTSNGNEYEVEYNSTGKVKTHVTMQNGYSFDAYSDTELALGLAAAAAIAKLNPPDSLPEQDGDDGAVTIHANDKDYEVVIDDTGKVTVKDPDGKIDEALSEELTKKLNKSKIDTDLKNTISTAIVEAFTSLKDELKDLDTESLTALASALSSIESSMSTLSTSTNFETFRKQVEELPSDKFKEAAEALDKVATSLSTLATSENWEEIKTYLKDISDYLTKIKENNAVDIKITFDDGGAIDKLQKIVELLGKITGGDINVNTDVGDTPPQIPNPSKNLYPRNPLNLPLSAAQRQMPSFENGDGPINPNLQSEVLKIKTVYEQPTNTIEPPEKVEIPTQYEPPKEDMESPKNPVKIPVEPEKTEFTGTGEITWSGEPEKTQFDGTGNVEWSGKPDTGPFHADGYITWHSRGGGGCFVAGTQISMANGTTKNIEDIVVGDLVVAYDYQYNQFITGRINKAYVHHNTPSLMRVSFSDGRTVTLTPGHPLLSTKGWKSRDLANSLYEHKTIATWLEVGDIIIGLNGTSVVINIEDVEVPENYDTYNAEVATYHTFIANGLVAHNEKFTPNNATGNVGLARATGTLMGELGPELVVSNGRYFVAGQNGAEMVNLSDDAIVFNHLQTEQLLKNGMSSGRGRAVTNERNAVAFATGNVNGGPAMASASAALAILKHLRAMWESLRGASVSDLAGAGGGGGGGGGGGDNAKIIDPRAWVDTVERWFDLMQKIAKCEREITHEETLRQKLQSDWLKNGKQYFASQTTSLKALREQINLQEELNVSRRDYFNKRIEALENEPLGKLYSFNAETGEMQFKGTQINGKDGVMEFLTDLVGFDNNKGANYTNKEKYDILMKAGFANYMKFDSNGMPIKKDSDNDGEITDEELESYYENATKAFWEHVDEFKESTESLFESIAEGENKLLELQASMNEIWEEMRDNQMEVENEVLEAIEDMKQREIDALQDERDKLEESVSKYIDGLIDALNKEQEMYEDQEAESELNRKRRQLGILQRSGASAADISSLQSEIDSSARDMYFDAQQRQIDAIQEASDKQLERMDTQIQLMTQQLEYQKMYGLLWNDVYSVMDTSAQQITDFIINGNSKFWSESPLSTQDKVNELIFKTEQWGEYRDKIDTITELATMTKKQMDAEAYNTFNQAMTKQYGANYDKGNKYTEAGGYREKFNKVWEETGDVTKATETARAAYAKDKKYLDQEAAAKSAGKAWMKDTAGDEYKSINDAQHWHYYYAQQTIAGVKGYYFQKAVKEDHNWSGDTCSKCGHAKPKPKESPSPGWVPPKGCGQNCSGYCKDELTGGSGSSSKRVVYTNLDGKARGGYVGHGVYELGEQGTETVLTASQTQVLRNNILSNRPNSLISLLKTYNSGFNQNKLASYSSDIQKRNEASESVNIENATVNMNISQIANDYDARRAGEQAMNEIMRIARKTSAANSIRR